MSIKTTRTIERPQAEKMLRDAILSLTNETLGDLLDVIADREEAGFSIFDNFLVNGDSASCPHCGHTPHQT